MEHQHSKVKYTCPMHPEIVQDKPGNCPKCGMNLISVKSKGEFFAITGDGVNDSPALAQTDVGIAVGWDSDNAAETAGIVLVDSNPKDVESLVLFGKAAYRKMIQYLVWAGGYKVVVLPLAAGVLLRMGILLSPAAGAVLMSISTVVVAVNASLLRVR